MKQFRVLETLRITGGEIGLDESQAQPRAHCLQKDGKDYLITAPVEFKAGEVLGIAAPEKWMAIEEVKPTKKEKAAE